MQIYRIPHGRCRMQECSRQSRSAMRSKLAAALFLVFLNIARLRKSHSRVNTLSSGSKIESQGRVTVAHPAALKHYDDGFSNLYNSPNVTEFPSWLLEYFEFHNEMRQKFPDRKLLEDPDAPKAIIKSCFSRKCGGTHDRLQDFNILFVAFRTKRILLLKWFFPIDLEHFLSPNLINWTMPHSDRLDHHEYFMQDSVSFEDGWSNLKPEKNRYPSLTDRLMKDPLLSESRFIRASSGGKQIDRPELPSDRIEGDLFGKVWHVIYRPSPLLEAEIRATTSKNSLKLHQYVACHCRMNHPARFNGKHQAGKINNTVADATGLPFSGTNKNLMVRTAVHAIQCASEMKFVNESVFFFSDSEDIVEYMTTRSPGASGQDRSSPGWNNESQSANVDLQSPLNKALLEVTNSTVIASRSTVADVPSVHIDLLSRGVGASIRPEKLVPIFVDLYMAIGARCLSYGVGNFAYLALKISNTRCVQIHETVNHKMQVHYAMHLNRAPRCKLPLPSVGDDNATNTTENKM